MDPLDQSVLIAILVALIAYFTKGKLWGGDATNDAIEKMGSFGGNTSDLVATMKKNGKKAVVFYGSQTGTAEDYALKFAKEFQSKFKVPTMTADLADVSFENFENIQKEIPDFKLAAFFMATYGEGEPTDNAVEFFDYLENECENLDSLKFVCFGLGNSTYEFYNAIGKKTASKLAEKGAELVGELGLGDDGKGTMDEDYLSWKEQLFDVVKATFHLDEQAVKYEPSIQTTESSDLDISSSTVSLGEPNSSYVNPVTDEDKNSLRFGPFNHTHPYLAPIINTKELFNSKDRHCIHAEFDLSDTNLKYSTGDHVAIWPSNSNQKVSKFLDILGLEKKKDQVIELKSLDPTVHLPFPSPTTYDAVLRHYLEISGPVSRQFVKSISQFCPNEKTKHALLEISDDKDLFNKSVTNKYLNIADCLAMLSEGEPWKDVPFSFIIESVAKLQPRYYSISSSSSMEKQKIHITAVVEQEKPEGCDHYVTGVATNLLLNIKKEQHKDKDLELIETYDLEGPRNKFHSKLPIHIRRSTFKLPSNPATPVIMVGPGTGAAPFRGFIREKVKQVENGNKVGDILFFFGCRNSTEDFVYKEEWTEYSKKLDSKFSMVTAFSRETEKKVYVQDKILENSARVVQLLDQGAFLYVCGDASNMAKGVQQTLVKVYQTEKKVTEEIATNMIKQLRVNNRYQEDVW